MKELSIASFLNSTQLAVVKAFLGEIFWDICAIRVAIEPDKVVVKVYHENTLDDEQVVALKFVEADIRESLRASEQVKVEFRIIKLNSSETLPIPQQEFAVYRRIER